MSATTDEAQRVRAELVSGGPTPCAELNLMLKYEAILRGVRDAIARLDVVLGK